MVQEPKRERGSQAAARVVWLRSAAAESQQPATGAIRKKAVIQALIGAAAGGVLFAFDHRILATVAWSIAALMLVTALVSPHGAHARLSGWIQTLGLWIGKLLTWVLLVPFYFLFFAPFGALVRRGRRDKMERWMESASPSYWHARSDPKATEAGYERQF